MSIPREEITEMIADVLGELEPCRHVARDGTCYECAAVQVMELFSFVQRNGDRFTLIRYGDDPVPPPTPGDDIARPWCPTCNAPAGPDCPDRSTSPRQVRARLKRELRREADHLAEETTP